MTEPKGIAGRILDIKNGLQARLRLPKLTNAAFGQMVAQVMDRRDANGALNPFGGSAVKQWIDGDRVPDLETLEAIAALGNVTAGALAFGERPVRSESEIDVAALYEQLTTASTPAFGARKKKGAASGSKRRRA